MPEMPLDLGCFLLGPSSLRYIGCGEGPAGPLACVHWLIVPSQSQQRQTGKIKRLLLPSPSSITLHLSLPGPGEANGFLTACRMPPFS